jgi:hypothetical protein
MKTQLFIPKKCKVGFNLRPDTYTGKLGYVIAHDGKVWRKEKSWLGWIEKYNGSDEIKKLKQERYNQQIKSLENLLEANKRYAASNHGEYYAKYKTMTLQEFLVEQQSDTLENFVKSGRCYLGKQTDDASIIPFEFDNVPTEGFVLNKKVGGYKSDWNMRQTYSRVFDPRGFEFEITVPNLLYILQETNSIKGKGLEGEFVYSWDGKDLVLLPTCSPDYQSCLEFTKIQKNKVSAKSLIPGASYLTKRQEAIIYLGKFEWNAFTYAKRNWKEKVVNSSKPYVFVGDKNKSFILLNSLSSLSNVVSETPVDNYAELIEKFNQEKYSKKVIGLESEPEEVKLPIIDLNDDKLGYHGNRSVNGNLYKKLSDNTFVKYYATLDIGTEYDYHSTRYKYKNKGYSCYEYYEVVFENGVLKQKNKENLKQEERYSESQLLSNNFQKLYVVLEDGTKIPYENY